jgi:peptide subunit release factor 1 (eRF1)
MGSAREYKCPKCGYKELASGGKDFGMTVAVETHICRDCQELTDVVTMWFMHDDPEMVHKEIDPKDYECTECGGKNLAGWDTEKKPCPKCGTTMTEEEGTEMLWD